MQVEVNETNIDLYKMAELTGNTREFMLSKAAEAATEGHILSCNVPDDLVLEQNVFEVYESEHVDPRRLKGCGYEKKEDLDGHTYMVCVIHGKTSRQNVLDDPHALCLAVDPSVVPTVGDAKATLAKSCAYNKIMDPREGSVYICVVHGKTSKYDISRVASMPCLAIDPLTPAEGDPHRP